MFRTFKTIEKKRNSFHVVKPKYDLDFNLVDLAIKKFRNPNTSERNKNQLYKKFIHKAIEIAVDSGIKDNVNKKKYRHDLIQDTFLMIEKINHARGLFLVVDFLIKNNLRDRNVFDTEILEKAIIKLEEKPIQPELEFDDLMEITVDKLNKLKNSKGEELYLINCFKKILKNEKQFNQYYFSFLLFENTGLTYYKIRSLLKKLDIYFPLSEQNFLKQIIKGCKTDDEKKTALLNFTGHKNIERGKELIEVRVEWIIERKKLGLKTIEIFNEYQSVFKRSRVTFDKDLAIANKRIKYLN